MKSLLQFVLILLALPAIIFADGFEIEKTDSGLTIKLNGEVFTNYVIDQANKPYFYPIIGPTDQPMTRAYPMEDVEDERKDHPHHRSLWFGHQGVGGFDTWHEKMTLEERYAKKGPEELEKAMQGLGATVHREFKKVEANGNTTTIVVTNDYVDSAGEKLMADERTYTLRWENDARIFDVDIVLSAPYGPIELKDMKDAGFSIRVPTVLDLKSEAGGSVTNSEGIKDGDAWGKRAKWCDYSGIVAGEAVGVAILNHPSSFRFPTPWHVRNYGLFTANPFGLSKVAGEEDGTFVLEGGKTVTLRHRVIFHKGNHADADIEAAWKVYAGD